ncbi:hypothetical protein DDB_G0285187 [Dictyostelium discoideum AX4]|uniref:Putative uncharacterized protein DDB_G0285187 n=1 Tax=Dictyostelium discoideum TaxID=44689 RepID=Y6387_DICDI|nr:hypothetical protein DDB_G0285187 [Dictyostelium discoideum AX4]Q54NK2.1 RecName: Full=Putative uncharacterized protein DDB_G0285187 [Dictyostelium discoideum]EAL64850.1 hypothetical protein DDB_G0285187 [Dictyostelium discoideum AX4]|eukprot:XP_638360.1 hypothetical protein DDB_G0285187 [Dictyostelium discoideum AX4]
MNFGIKPDVSSGPRKGGPFKELSDFSKTSPTPQQPRSLSGKSVMLP